MSEHDIQVRCVDCGRQFSAPAWEAEARAKCPECRNGAGSPTADEEREEFLAELPLDEETLLTEPQPAAWGDDDRPELVLEEPPPLAEAAGVFPDARQGPPVAPPAPPEPRPSKQISHPWNRMPQLWRKRVWGTKLLVGRASSLVVELWRELVVSLGVCLVGILVCMSLLSIWIGAGLIVGALLWAGYWISVSLRRQEPDTPEQAVRQYFAALAYPLPHYRRMYCLLSSQAQQVPEFSTYVAFRAYWRYRLAQVKPEQAGWRLIVVELRDLKTECDAQGDSTQVTYTLDLFLRGRREQPLAGIAMQTKLVKGRDGMWYVDDGRIPDWEKGGSL